MMRTQEEWKSVVDYEGLYEVSDLGRVKSVPRPSTKGGILKPSPDCDGYLLVKLCKNGEKEPCRVHQLVMQAFVGRCPDGYEVDHENWNIVDNRLENLSYQPKELNRGRHSPEWRKNQAEAVRKARCKPVNQYTLDGEFVKTWESAAEAARELGIYNSNISKCCNGKNKSTGGFIWKFAQ